MDMDDMVRMMMGGGGGMPGGMGGMGGGPQRRRKGKDVGIAFPVSLEDLYTGKRTNVPREKTILCPSCKGTGCNKPGKSAQCQMCRGQGARIMMRQVGPGMMQQVQVPCDTCQGRGTNMRPEDKCKACNASMTTTSEQPLTVNIEPGMEHDQQIPFPGEGDQSPEYEIPGAIVIVLRQLKHDRFTRDDNDLHMTLSITLAEALCGGVKTFKHLDDREIAIEIAPRDAVRPGVQKCVKNMGMPVYGQRGRFGDLIIKFRVTFPESLDEEAVASLRKLLPPPANQAPAYDEATSEEATCTRTPLDEMRKEMEKENDDDDDDEGGAGGVRCATQ